VEFQVDNYSHSSIQHQPLRHILQLLIHHNNNNNNNSNNKLMLVVPICHLG
jgi:hypothetical protein